VLNPDTSDYELVEFKSGEKMTAVINPADVDWGDEVDWSGVAPDWIREHGTVVILLGSEEYPDTILGNPRAGERDIKGLSVYLNTRFWDLKSAEIRVLELRSEKKNAWPTGPDDRDDARRPNNRQIFGAKHYLTGVKATSGVLAAASTLFVDQERVMVDWYLWEGERPAIHSYAKKPGYIAVRYKDELFQLTTNKAHFRWFGVVESAVQQNLSIILEPQLYDHQVSMWGVHPDQSRNRLIFTGNGERGVELPLSDWGLEFAENLPDEIRAAIQKARGELTGSLDDDEYRKRLQDRFGNRWRIKRLVQAVAGELNTKPATPTTETIDVDRADTPFRQRSRNRRNKTVQVVRMRAVEAGSSEGVERQVPVDVPRYRYGTKDDFEHAWHLAAWVPNDPDGPTVVLNSDSPILRDAIRHHQEQYPDVYAEEVEKTVREVYAEVAVCKVAHSQKLAAQISEQDLDQHYRSEAALTVGLMGLLAEETLIAQRLGRLGRKKPAA
jgi:hypothetical protein